MKRKILMAGFLMTSIIANAQIAKISDFETQYIKPMFPIVAGIVFIIGVLVNLPKLKGEDRDIKKFFVSVLIYPAALMLVSGLYALIRGMSL